MTAKHSAAGSPDGRVSEDAMHEYSLLLNTPASVAILEGPQHVFKLANEHYERMVNYRELIGKTVRQAFPELEEQGFYKLLDRVYETQEPFIGRETPVTLYDGETKDERRVYMDLTYNPIINKDKQTTGIFVHATDVTEAVNNREIINSARRRYKMVLNSVDEGFCIIDVQFDATGKPVDYTFVEANENFAEQTGLKDAIGKTAAQLVPGLEQHWFDMYGKVAKSGKPVRFSQGSAQMGRWFDVQATKVDGDSGNLVALLFKDVTESHTFQLELEQSKQRYDALFNSNTVALVTSTFDGVITEANNNFLRLFGLTHDDIAHGINTADLSATVDPNRQRMYDDIRTKGEAGPLTRRYVRRDGTEFPALVGSVKLPDDSDRFVAFVVDQSENEQLKELNRTKDEFIALASHQLRTPATAVKQYLGIVTDEYAGPINADQLQYLTIANNANDRQLMIIEDLLKTARIDTRGFGLTLTPNDLHETTHEIMRQYVPVVQTKNQKMTYAGPNEPVIAPFDKPEMSICIANLIENASKYSPSDTTVYVTLSQTKNHVDLTVRDEGVGIADDDIEKIFDKFTRVHNELSDTTSGSGLGLYWVKRIVDIHKGKLMIESKLGEGTTFTIRLKK